MDFLAACLTKAPPSATMSELTSVMNNIRCHPDGKKEVLAKLGEILPTRKALTRDSLDSTVRVAGIGLADKMQDVREAAMAFLTVLV